MKRGTPLEWFAEKIDMHGPTPVDRPDLGACWVWCAAEDGHGYGVFWSKGRAVKAYCFSYEMFVGPVPDELVLDHLCRNPACVRPDHLEPVTQRINLLRGKGFAAVNARKSRCPRGHLYSHVASTGWRRCRQCDNELRKRRREASQLQ